MYCVAIVFCNMLTMTLFLSFTFVATVSGMLMVPPFTDHIQSVSTRFSEEDVGDPLVLTEMLGKGDYLEAQKQAQVQPAIGNMTSYSGYFLVDNKCRSHLFFWFFPAQTDDWEDAPVVLWLNGGPGATSLFGLFEENGPIEVDEDGVRRRQYSWNQKNNVIYIDQPAGTGFSFTRRRYSCYAFNQTHVGENLYEAIVQFYQLFPKLMNNKFFIAGESFAGHYIPALGHFIHKNNPTAEVKINLAAMMIGNGLSDMERQSDWGSFLYQIGLIDTKGKEAFDQTRRKLLESILREDYEDATSWWQGIIGDLYQEFVGNNSLVNRYNYINGFEWSPFWKQYIQSAGIRKALHVGNEHFDTVNVKVYYSLFKDISRSVKPWIEELLEFYPIIFYNGQLDIICGYPMMINFIRDLDWNGQSRYLSASRSKWCVGQEQAGYFKGQHHLYDVLVRGAGHMVPTDQPHWAYELVNSVTSGTPDNPLHALTVCSDFTFD